MAGFLLFTLIACLKSPISLHYFLPIYAGLVCAWLPSTLRLTNPLEAISSTLLASFVVANLPVLVFRLAPYLSSAYVPVVWAAAVDIAARASPLGRTAIFGHSDAFISHFSSIIPLLGKPGLDFILMSMVIAASAVANKVYVQLYYSRPYGKCTLVKISALLSLYLVIGLFSNTSPLTAQHFPIACILPASATIESYLHEARIYAARGSRLLLFPESAISISTQAERNDFIRRLEGISEAHGSFIAGTIAQTEGQFRTNELVLLGPHDDQPLLSYQKQHLVPIGESTTSRPARSVNLPVADLPIHLGAKHVLNIRVAPAICHDTAFPLSFESSVELLLVPAHVKSSSISRRRLSDLRIMALKYRTAILVCDREGYSSYITANGQVQANHLGRLGSFEVAHGWQESFRSPYFALGSTASLSILLCLTVISQIKWSTVVHRLRTVAYPARDRASDQHEYFTVSQRTNDECAPLLAPEPNVPAESTEENFHQEEADQNMQEEPTAGVLANRLEDGQIAVNGEEAAGGRFHDWRIQMAMEQKRRDPYASTTASLASRGGKDSGFRSTSTTQFSIRSQVSEREPKGRLWHAITYDQDDML